MPTRLPPGASPTRTVLAEHEHYRNAQADVDALSDRGFPVARLSIIGTDLYLVETVTGRLTTLRAAARGAASGAGIGLALGALLALLTTAGPLAVPIGAAVGALLGASGDAAGHARLRGRRDFSATSQLTAARYLLLVDSGWADDARLLLLHSPNPGSAPAPAADRSTSGPGKQVAAAGRPPGAQQKRPP